MSLVSNLFLLFVAVSVLVYYIVPHKFQWLVLLCFSYIYYLAGGVRYVGFILFSTLVTWGIALAVEKAEAGGSHKSARNFLVLGLILNFGMLGVIKYTNFMIENLNALFHMNLRGMEILLPLGISFYTFQSSGYLLDVYWKRCEAEKNPVKYALFVSFFPQILQGPIGRYSRLAHQLYEPHKFEGKNITRGFERILWGFFKKMIIADNCAMAVNEIWGSYQYQSGFTLLLGGLLFTFQIYGDFSGYSDIAIGCARLFGIDLMKNFNYPYFSRDISEFWRRWHISLSTWFRDYIYIPLGGSRCKKTKIIRNTFIIFIISGLWHGANWTFILWGIYHALLFMPLLLLNKNRRYTKNVIAEGKLLPSFKEAVQMFSTFFLVLIGWIIFRSNDIGEASDYLARLFSPSLFEVSFPHGKRALIYCLVLLIIEWMQREKEHALQINKEIKSPVVRWGIYYILIFIIVFLQGTPADFIYFQF